MATSVRPERRPLPDPLDVAWQQAQSAAPRPPATAPTADPLDAAFDRAQSPATVATPASNDPLDRAFDAAQPAPAAQPRILPEPGVVEWPPMEPQAPEDAAVTRHRERFGTAPVQVARDRDTGATVTTGQPIPIGIPKSEVDRLVGDPSLSTRVHARLELLNQPEGYTYQPKASTFADLLADTFMGQMASPLVGRLADENTERRMQEYAAGGGQLSAKSPVAIPLPGTVAWIDDWRASLLGTVAATGALAGNVALMKAIGGAGRSGTGSDAAALRVGMRAATPAMRAGAVKAVRDIARENQIHPSLVAKLVENTRRAMVARAPLAGEIAASAGTQGVAGTAIGATSALAEGERDPVKVARAAAESGLTFAALGALFHGMSVEAQFRAGYDAARQSLLRAEQLRTAVAGEQLRRTAGEPSEEFGPGSELTTTRPPTPRAPTSIDEMEIPTNIRAGAPAPAGPMDPLDVAWTAAQPSVATVPAASGDPYVAQLEARTDIGSYEKARLREAYERGTAELEAQRAGAATPTTEGSSPAVGSSPTIESPPIAESPPPAASAVRDASQIPGNLRERYQADDRFAVLVDRIRTGERVNPMALKAYPELGLQYGEQVAARWRQPAEVAPDVETLQTSVPETPRAQEPAVPPSAGEPGALGRPAGSGAGAAVDAAAPGSRGAGVQAGEGAPVDASDAGATEAAAAAVAVRDGQGRLRRNLRNVPTPAIADEILAIGDAIAADPAVPSVIGTEGSGVGYTSVWTGMKAGAAKAAGRTKARQQAMARLTAEIERRGENVDELLDAALERQAERGGMQADDTRRPRKADEEEVAPGVRFSPAQEGPDLFGRTEKPAPASDQTSMFGGKEGTTSARSLSDTERAARSELERQKVIATKSTDPAVQQRAQRRVAELEKLVNRGGKITPEELSTRAAAEREPLGDEDAGPTQQALFSPAAPSTPLGAKVRAALGMSARSSARAAREVKSLMEISQALADMAGVPLRQGRFGASRRQAVGVFIPNSEVTRVIRFDKLDTAAHEVGHYVSQKYLRNPTMKGAKTRSAPALTMAMKRELVKMGRDLYGSRKPAGGYGEEGIAQWARFYVVDPAQLKADAPLFSDWMDQNILTKEPGLKAALDQGRADFAAYREAPATARVDAIISIKPGFRMLPDPRDLATWYLDDIAEVRRAVEELVALGTAVVPEKQAYILARLTRGAAGVADEMIDRGIVDPATGKRVTRGIREILGGLKKEDIQPLRRYLVAERALEFWERGINSGVSRADATAIVAQYTEKYRKVAEELWGVSNALIDYRVAKHNLTPEEGRQIKTRNKRRVGFYRVFEEEDVATPRAGFGRGFGRNSSGIQRATGSSRDIIDPLESILTDVYKTVKQAHSTEVLAALVAHAEQTQGGGRVLEVLLEVPQERVAINVQKVMGQLAELGLTPEGAEEGEMSSRDITGMLVAFRDKTTAGPKETKDLVRPVVIDGERKWIQLKDARLFDALSGLGTPELPMWLRWVSLPTRTLRAGATLTLEFITRNPARDAVTAAIYSRAGFKLPGFDLVLGLFHTLRQDATYQRWRLEGGDNAAMLGLDRPTVRRHLKEVLRSRTARATGWVLHPIDTLRILSSLFENATRIGEFAAVEARALKRGASAKAAAVEGTIAARDVTIDFAQAGTQTRIANQLLAFLNANVRGWAKLLRELKERPTEVGPRILALITLPSLLLWWLQKDDEEYQNVPTWQKTLAWVIIDRDENGEVQHIWRIPKPPDLGILFGTIPERIAEWLYRDDPKSFDKFAESLESLNPAAFPNAIAPVIEWWANKNLFTDRRIVPEGAVDLPAGEQSTSRTGEFARVVGGATDLSPAKLENTVRGYTGGLGQYFLEAANAGTRGARAVLDLPALPTPAKRETDKIENLPGVRGFMVREPLLDAQPVQDVLDLFREGEAWRQAWRKRLAAGDGSGARAYFKEHEVAIRAVASQTDNLDGGVGNLRRARDLITDAQQLVMDADDATRRRVADIAIATARAVLAGDAVKRVDIRTLKRELAQRKRVAVRNTRLNRSSEQ